MKQCEVVEHNNYKTCNELIRIENSDFDSFPILFSFQ